MHTQAYNEISSKENMDKTS